MTPSQLNLLLMLKNNHRLPELSPLKNLDEAPENDLHLDTLKILYKCAGKSPVQAPDHKGSGCLLYQGRALASYICSQCKLGVHLNADCLQAEGKQDDLAKRVKELGLPVNMGEVQVQLIDEESKNA